MDDLNGIIEIQDAAIDMDTLNAQVRTHLEQRGEFAREQGLDFESVKRGMPDYETRSILPRELYFNLVKAEISQQQLNVEPDYRPVSRSIVGRVWHQIRRQAHGLVMFYVNKAVAHQMVSNRYMLNVLQQLVAQVEHHVAADNISDLAEVREQLTRLEQHVTG